MVNLKGLTREQVFRGRARHKHLHFMKYCWNKKEPFVVGRHTESACKEIDIAFENYRKGISTFLCIKIPFRHGKSDIVSRFLPTHFLGEFPEDEIICTGYSASLVYKFSRVARRLIRSRKYRELYPEIMLSREVANVETWELDNGQGKAQWVGLGGSMVGSGGSLLICDDFYKNREEAESATIRDKRWESFTNDFLTRAAPVFIAIVLATPWHPDDLFGRIEEEMKKSEYFPRFKDIKFPAWTGDEPEKRVYLFTERFSKGWYLSQEASLGNYATAALLLCDPRGRTGRMLHTENIKFVSGVDEFIKQAELEGKTIRFKRGWDLASSIKQTQRHNPDWTIGVKGTVIYLETGIEGVKVMIVYVDDVIRMREEAPKRQRVIRDTAIGDGQCEVGIEAFAAYKDAFTQMKETLKGIRMVRKMQLPGDKQVKVSVLESPFEAGNVYFKRADWNKPFIDVLKEFPSGTHDDDADALAVMAHMFSKADFGIYTSTDLRRDKEALERKAA